MVQLCAFDTSNITENSEPISFTDEFQNSYELPDQQFDTVGDYILNRTRLNK